MFRRIVLAPLAVLLVAGVAWAEDPKNLNTLTPDEKGSGWKLLFDGKTTDGWRGYKRQDMPTKWSVVKGTLVFNPKASGSGGDVVTKDEYENFELVLEWKISPGGNSGLMYHVNEKYEAPYETGPEYQLLDNAKHPDGRSKLTSAASCYALYAPSKDATKPVGEWNVTKLVVNNGKVEHWLNDEKVVSYDLSSTDWQQHVAKSKFKDMPAFGKEAKGHIDLQDHGNEIAFRNIKIRELK